MAVEIVRHFKFREQPLMMRYVGPRLALLAMWSIALTLSGYSADRVYREDGDLIIGGIIPLHFNDAPLLCGGTLDLSALRRVEALRYTVSEINGGDLLGGITLGYEIYDSCASPEETVRHSLEFVPEVRVARGREDNVIGVIGPQRSANSIQANRLLGLYNVTTVSYLSTSDELSDSRRFPYFMRMVPPDKFQVSVITDILKRYGWKYVAFVHSDDNYGSNAEEEFRVQAAENDICVAYIRGVSGSEEARVYDEVIGDLLDLKRDSLLSVVILFTQQEPATKIFEHARMANVSRDFIWIGSDGAGNYDLTPVDGNEEAVLGAFIIVPKAESHVEFNSFFGTTVFCDNSTSKPTNVSSGNPWLSEYCQIYDNDEIHRFSNPPYESLVIDAVHVIARGLRAMKDNTCNDIEDMNECARTLTRNRRLLRDYFLNVTFDSVSNGPVSFSANGDSVGHYNIRYLTEDGDRSYRFISNGTWLQNDEPQLALGPVIWYLEESDDRESYTEEGIPKSACSDTCGVLQITRTLPQGCCWTCVECADHEIISESECVSCIIEANETYMWPDPTLTFCKPLAKLRLAHEVENVVLLVLALMGIVSNVVVGYLYIKQREKRLIKASSRELSYIILVGIFLAYASAILFCTPAHIVSCYLRRIVPSIATTFIYVSLLTMTVRLYRIFIASQNTTRRPQFISPASQVALTMAISIIPLVWGLVWIIIRPPAAIVIPPTSERQIIEKMCVVSKADRIGQLVWEVFIVLVNCYLAFRTRSLPANYNQTRFIAFSVFSSLVVIIAFAPAFFTTEISSQRDLYSALGYIIQPTVVLILIFVARIYAIYFVEEKDQQVLSTRPSARKESGTVMAPPSPARTASTSVIYGSTPTSLRSWTGEEKGRDVHEQMEAGDVFVGPSIYKHPGIQNSDKTSSVASIEIHSLEGSEANLEAEALSLGVLMQNTDDITVPSETDSTNVGFSPSRDDQVVDTLVTRDDTEPESWDV